MARKVFNRVDELDPFGRKPAADLGHPPPITKSGKQHDRVVGAFAK
jgi:hypothetical protein